MLLTLAVPAVTYVTSSFTQMACDYCQGACRQLSLYIISYGISPPYQPLTLQPADDLCLSSRRHVASIAPPIRAVGGSTYIARSLTTCCLTGYGFIWHAIAVCAVYYNGSTAPALNATASTLVKRITMGATLTPRRKALKHIHAAFPPQNRARDSSDCGQ